MGNNMPDLRERVCLDQLVAVHESDPTLAAVLSKVAKLFVVGLITSDLIFYVRKQIITSVQSQEILDMHSALIKV